MKRSTSRTGIGSIYPAVILVISLAFLPPAAMAAEYTFSTLDHPSAPWGTYIFDINNSGQIAGQYRLEGEYSGSGFVYKGGVFTDLDTGLPNNEAGGAEAYGINDSGEIAGTCFLIGSDYGFVYSGGAFNWFADPIRSDYMQAFGINNRGQVTGFYHGVIYEPPSNFHGFIYDDGAFTILDVPSAFGTYAQGINDSGQVVGYYDTLSEPNYHGFLYVNGAFTALDVPTAVDTYAEGINNKGQVTGYYTDNANHHHGFIYSNGVFTTIDVPSAVDTYAFGINDSGQIVGYYWDGTGNYWEGTGVHGFIATPVVKTVRIDILPLLPNIIPLWPNWGIIPVTIFSTKDFSAPRSIDPQTLTFGDTGDQKSFAFCDPFNLDINRDGYRDLTCYFQKQYAGFQCGDAQGILKGATMDGVPVKGTDSVRIFPCK